MIKANLAFVALVILTAQSLRADDFSEFKNLFIPHDNLTIEEHGKKFVITVTIKPHDSSKKKPVRLMHTVINAAMYASKNKKREVSIKAIVHGRLVSDQGDLDSHLKECAKVNKSIWFWIQKNTTYVNNLDYQLLCIYSSDPIKPKLAP